MTINTNMQTRKIAKAKRKGSKKNGLGPQNIKIKKQTCTKQNTTHQTKKRKRSEDDDDTSRSAKKVCKFSTFDEFYSTCSKEFISKHHLPESSNRNRVEIAAKRALQNIPMGKCSKWQNSDNIFSKQSILRRNSIGFQRLSELEKLGKFSVNGKGGRTHNIQSFIVSLDNNIATIMDFMKKTSKSLFLRFRKVYLPNCIGYKNEQVHHFGWQKKPKAA